MRSILLILLALSVSSTQAQYLTLFPNDTTDWETTYCNLDDRVPSHHRAYNTTTMWNNTYLEVGQVHNGSYSFTLQQEGYYLIREDITTGRAWVLGLDYNTGNPDTVERLIMDITLQVGDPFPVYNHSSWTYDTAYVDSIWTAGGRHYVRTDYYHPMNLTSSPLTMVEGVGTNWGVSYQHWSVNLCPCLITWNTGAVGGGPNAPDPYVDSSCYVTIMGQTDLAEDDFEVKIYPNPGEDNFTISSDEVIRGINVLDLSGRVIFAPPIHSRQTHTVWLPNLRAGTYLIRVEGERSTTVVRWIKS